MTDELISRAEAMRIANDGDYQLSSGERTGRAAVIAEKLAALPSVAPATCLMADCTETQAHFCVDHVLEVHCPAVAPTTVGVASAEAIAKFCESVTLPFNDKVAYVQQALWMLQSEGVGVAECVAELKRIAEHCKGRLFNMTPDDVIEQFAAIATDALERLQPQGSEGK